MTAPREQTRPGGDVIPFTREDVKTYLDRCIRRWRSDSRECAMYYVDAFQSVRTSLFGELLPQEDGQPSRAVCPAGTPST